MKSAHLHGLISCDHCGLVSQIDHIPADAPRPCCPRCDAPLRRFKPQSLQRTWAYLWASVVMYVPANAMPIMQTTTVIGDRSHTIIGGIAELWGGKTWELAIVVFIASIAVPLLKIASLAYLAFTAGRESSLLQRERGKLYRIVENVGHWSMLDVFVVVLLVAMVRFSSFASVQPQPGLLAFGAVVILTMLASASFDPRLIWTPSDAQDEAADDPLPEAVANERSTEEVTLGQRNLGPS
ncbi:MAG: hypothetical protein JWP52_3648 [Rhizobacter sp.]|jgi:paraquat-inducible protein A|nr:hypothetical protein [Rhizobacter sp.]